MPSKDLISFWKAIRGLPYMPMVMNYTDNKFDEILRKHRLIKVCKECKTEHYVDE